ncbi:type II toxin-antitoxin system PemK/MazF family toxin [Nocardia sp. NPDC050712]|uniref:type II toxin-antitoxin system PemK/MazF family toxin n=1 Tax=Nocardia sp. NPDC050712 TaxID=3155518 RepID=UPI0033F06772
MRRGEVWWVEFDERRPVVLLDGDESSGFQTLQVVPPSGIDLGGLGIEVQIGAIEGVPYQGVVRLAFPNPDVVFCTWLTTVSAESLIARATVLTTAKLDEIDTALRLSTQPRESPPEAMARLDEIRDVLRRGGFRD